MEHQLWKSIVAILGLLNQSPSNPRCTYSNIDIVKVYYWSVIHDRPVRWACDPKNWPLWLRRLRLPSPPAMSRRLKSHSVVALLTALEQRVLAPKQPGLFWIIDGKPLTIGGCSKDRQAGYGRAANCMAKGYKIHAIINSHKGIAAWRLAPMNKDERVMAARLLRSRSIQGYLLGDANFDSNPLHALCGSQGQLQLVTPRRYGRKRGIGHTKQTPGRLRSIALLENPYSRFGKSLLRLREKIERYFAWLTNWGGGLTSLPPWVRTHRRVHRWVQAKMILTELKQSLQIKTYVA